MSFKAVFFGAIGTILETSEIQRSAFNAAFKDAGLDWHWNRELYQSLLVSAGGEKRIERFAADRNETVDAAALHSAKTKHFNELMKSKRLEPRAGVLQILQHARDEKMNTAFVTTTSQENIDLIFGALGNSIIEDDFDYIGRRDLIEHSKPAPDIYMHALNTLGLEADSVVAIEDTESGVASAVAAGISTIAFPGDNSKDHDWSNAVLTTEILHPDQLSAIRPSGRSSVSQDFRGQK